MSIEIATGLEPRSPASPTGGTLVTSHFTFLPRLDPIVRASEELVLEHNPKWSGADWDGRIPAHPKRSRSDFVMRAMFFYDEAIPFTRESWRGRIRALRGIGATLSTKEVAVFEGDGIGNHATSSRRRVILSR